MVILLVMFLIGLPSIFSFSAQEVFDNIILCTEFDEGLGKDESVTQRTGTVNTAGVSVSDTIFKTGNASAFFNGDVFDPIEFTADAPMNSVQNMSILVWSNYTDTDSIATTWGRGDGSQGGEGRLAFNSAGQERITCLFESGSGPDVTATATGQTAFITTTHFELIGCHLNWSGSVATAYLTINDTVIAQSGAVAGTATSSTQEFTIGDIPPNTPGEQYVGGLDTLIFVNKTLSTDDISNHLLNGGSGTTCADIVVAPDTTIPSFQEDSINNSLPRLNEDVLVSQVLSDNIALSEARVSHNQSGTFVNQSLQTLSGISFNASDTITVTASKNTVVGYQWWGNDTSGNSNTSIVRTFVVQNTPPSDPIIIFPTASLRTNVQPLDLDVTFPADVDGDSITISYFINGTINSTSSLNSTFTASDGNYLLEVSIDDGTDFSNNVSVEFELDTTAPAFGADSIDNSLPRLNDDVLVSQVLTDRALDFTRVAHNQSGLFVNQTIIDISGISINSSDTITVTASKGTVVGYQWWANDTLDNTDFSVIRTFTVVNTPPENPTIIFPTSLLRTNLQPLDLNVTFPADVDGDILNINFYINGTLNSTSTSNGTFIASDGFYTLNVSVDDGTDSSPGNDTVDFELDTINPVIVTTSPLDLSTQTGNVTVDITCTDSNPFILNYTLFNSSFDLLRTVQDSIVTDFTLEIIDEIDITELNMSDADYQMNISCSDTHTKKQIEDYIVTSIPNGFRYETTEGNRILINQIGKPAIPGFKKETDRYEFSFGNSALTETRTFRVIATKNKIEIIESEFPGHLIIRNGNKGNWIDFKSSDGIITEVKRISPNQVEVKVSGTDFSFKSIGGLNVVTEVITFTLDTTVPPPAVPPITALAVFPLENASSLVGVLALFILILGIIFGQRAFTRKR